MINRICWGSKIMKCPKCGKTMVKMLDGYLCTFDGTQKIVLKSKTTNGYGIPYPADETSGSWDNAVKAIEGAAGGTITNIIKGKPEEDNAV